MENKIIILEGSDCSGKTTLSNAIMQHYPNHVYIHNAVVDDIYSLHLNTLTTAIEASKWHTVIIDRLHLSEDVYGTTFRNGPSYDTHAFDKKLDEIGNIVKILCHVDKDVAMQKHKSRIDNEMFDNISKVWDMYNSIEYSNWKKYNWMTDKIDLDTFEISKKD